MLQRTKGRILLALLVVTGMAGTLKDTTISQKERKTAAIALKQSRSDFFKSVKDLSPEQLRFKPAPGQASIEEKIYQAASAELAFGKMIETALAQRTTPAKRSSLRLSDTDLETTMSNRPELVRPIESNQKNWKSVNEALATFKAERSDRLKYVKTTTEDLRNHLVELPSGILDSYQLILLSSINSSRYVQEIKAIMADPTFPNK